MTRRWMMTPVALTILAVAAYVSVRLLRAPELSEGIIYGNGHIEGTDIRVSAEVSGRVLRADFEEGTAVERGEVLATLDDADLQAQLDRANAEVRAVDQQRAATDRELATWRHHLTTATENLERVRSLEKQDIAARQQVDAAEDRYEEARGKVEILESTLGQAGAQLDAAKSEVKFVKVQLAKTSVAAPLSATVMVKAAEAGEYVTPGQPIAILVDLRSVKLKVYIPERDIAKIKLGDPARVRVDAFPERFFDGVVSKIDQDAQFTPKDIHVPAERTRMVFGVELRLENETGLLKPGMPGDAWIRWRSDVPWPKLLPVPAR